MNTSNKTAAWVMSLFFLSQQVLFGQTTPLVTGPDLQPETSIEENLTGEQGDSSAPVDPTALFLSQSNTLSQTDSRLAGQQSLSSVPAQPSLVRVQSGDRRLLIRDRLSDGSLGQEHAYVAKGVNWEPHSPGVDPANIQGQYAQWYQTDLPLMAQMGINTVRVYYDFGTGPEAFQILDKMYECGIKVIMVVDTPKYGDVANLSNITTVVNAYKNHPAILMWSIGNEWDLNRYYGKFWTFQEAAQYTEQAAQLVKSLDTNHPVTTVIAEPEIIGTHCFSQSLHDCGSTAVYMDQVINTQVTSVDVWGVNIYRGNSFQGFFDQWNSVVSKPMYIGEFGADSYDHRIGAENQTMQAQMDGQLWDEVYFDLSAQRSDGAAIGALMFEWNDEWWKNGTPTTHTISGESNWGQLDGVNDEEWFGIVDINRNLKSAFDLMKNRFSNGASAVQLNANPMIKAVSQASGTNAQLLIDDKTVYNKAGGGSGGRGMNVGVLDPYTGLAMTVKNFDTWSADYWGGPHRNFAALTQYLDSLPNGAIISIAVADEAGIANPNNNNQPWTDSYVQAALQYFETLGSTKIRQVVYRGGWALIYVKGQGVLAEGVSGQIETVSIQAQVNLQLNPDYNLLSDTVPPDAVISVNGGAATTEQRQITVDLAAADDFSGLGQMRFTTDPVNWTWTDWEDYTPQKTLTLPASTGSARVYCQIYDQSWNLTTVYDDIQFVDTTPPAATIAINGGAPATDQLQVTLNLTAGDGGTGLGKMRFATDTVNWNWTDWEDFSATKTLTLPAGFGDKKVFWQIYDQAWNLTTTYDEIQVVDTTPPVATIMINGGAATTDQLQVTVNLTASDPVAGLGKMRFATDTVNWTWSAWEDFSATKILTLPAGNGTKRVYWQIYDQAWNLTTTYDDIQVVDTTAPTAAIAINGGAAWTDQLQVTLNLTASDSGTGLAKMRFTADTVNWTWSAWEDFSATKAVTLPAGDGNKQVYVQIYDQAWNLTTVYDDILYVSALPVIPENWTRATSNPYFAFTDYYTTNPIYHNPVWQVFKAWSSSLGTFYTRTGETFSIPGNGPQDYVTSVRDVSPDGGALVYGLSYHGLNYAQLLRVSDTSQTVRLELSAPLASIAFKQDGTALLTAQESGGPAYCYTVDLNTLTLTQNYLCSGS